MICEDVFPSLTRDFLIKKVIFNVTSNFIFLLKINFLLVSDGWGRKITALQRSTNSKRRKSHANSSQECLFNLLSAHLDATKNAFFFFKKKKKKKCLLSIE
jgi:hypothetical protein